VLARDSRKGESPILAEEGLLDTSIAPMDNAFPPMKLPEEVRKFFAKHGSVGGKKRSAGMSLERRREIARNASKARWSKAKKSKKAK
jgi:hypothetical protein